VKVKEGVIVPVNTPGELCFRVGNFVCY